MKKKLAAMALATAMAVTTVGGATVFASRSMVRPAKELRHGMLITRVLLRSEQRQIWLSVKL